MATALDLGVLGPKGQHGGGKGRKQQAAVAPEEGVSSEEEAIEAELMAALEGEAGRGSKTTPQKRGAGAKRAPAAVNKGPKKGRGRVARDAAGEGASATAPQKRDRAPKEKAKGPSLPPKKRGRPAKKAAASSPGKLSIAPCLSLCV